MLKWLTRLFSRDNKHTIQRHIDGSPSVVFTDGCVRVTENSILGSVILFSIETNFGNNIKFAKGVLLNKYDDCLTQKSKDKIISIINKVLINRRYTCFTREKDEKHLTFKVKYISRKQAKELKACLAQSGEHRLYTAEVVGSKPTASTK